ncbi:adenine phosphoribosyltransferase [Actinotalea sp. Marseille-Q4924]|uniref:adenine phosphoribosyltransferase n=1 Tax=Actinotalea sp. Marseille-Q4924 TaxID=2866571 RepID=UPI001CE4A600|nr:adenine phosphoribosyltransferase [Actinotalea sp. Marseille-Q4924]
MTEDQLVERVRELIHDVPDYPEPGVVFKDITPLLADGPVFRAVVDHMAGTAPGRVDLVVGMEARGFILGAPVAAALGAGFIPARKAGKLPRETVTGAYDLEYGSAVLEVHADTIGHGARVLVVDDVLATGGTAAATVELIGRTGGEVVGLSFLMELTFLHGREKLDGQRLDVLVGF